MALVLKDRVRETSTTTGTGTFTLAGAVAGFQSFSVIGTGNSTYYTIVMSTDWEVGIGTWTSPNQLSRDTILASTNAGAAVNFGSGTKDIFLTYPAEVAIAGSGTTNYVTKFTGTSAIGDSLIYDNGTNVGIGTSSPATKLTVDGSITITGANALRGSYGGGGVASNFAAGDGALTSNTTGYYNTANGQAALYFNTTGNYNTANGRAALYLNTTGNYNTANGVDALRSNTTGLQNTANGQAALYSNTTGNYNTANGVNALVFNTTGNYNTANGQAALRSNTTGNYNTANGVNALLSNTTGSLNTANGQAALQSNTTGSNNIALGYSSGSALTTQNNCVVIGSNNGSGMTNNQILIADGAGNERMRINSAGNVGIGTSSPATKLDVDGLVKTKGYTVATLPTGVTGARAYVTDATALTFLGTLTGGGTVTCPVFYNGTAWVSG